MILSFIFMKYRKKEYNTSIAPTLKVTFVCRNYKTVSQNKYIHKHFFKLEQTF